MASNDFDVLQGWMNVKELSLPETLVIQTERRVEFFTSLIFFVLNITLHLEYINL